MHSIIVKVRHIILPLIKTGLFLPNLIFFTGFLLCACVPQQLAEDPSPDPGKIESPVSGAIVSLGQRILLRSTSISDWYSSIDGALGTGRTLTISLSLGEHVVSIRDKSAIVDTILIRVLEPPLLDRYTQDIQGEGAELILPSGSYSTSLISFGSSDSSVQISATEYGPASPVAIDDTSRLSLQRDLLFWATTTTHGKTLVKQSARHLITAMIGDERQFRFVNLTTGSGNDEPVLARLVWSSVSVDIWLDSEASLSDEIIKSMGMYLNDFLIPHHIATWGQWIDIDRNGKLSVLCTLRFNTSGKAVGLFNPSDFFAFSSDSSSSEFNPLSNEMDILYSACPDDVGSNANFWISTVFATLAHEFQHLTSFSEVYRQYVEDSLPVPVFEESFLEEGLSHLAENLAGYGFSGGNSAFVARYLARTESTPLGTVPSVIYGDSVERRGGMTLLLSWLYENQNSNGQTNFFLNTLYKSRKRGWKRIEEATGMNREQILEDFASFLARDRNIPIRVHPYTGEPVMIDPWAGEIESFGMNFSLSGPMLKDTSSFMNIAPLSILFGQPVAGQDYLRVYSERIGGTGIIRLLLERD